jgi:hypothetical protein
MDWIILLPDPDEKYPVGWENWTRVCSGQGATTSYASNCGMMSPISPNSRFSEEQHVLKLARDKREAERLEAEKERIRLLQEQREEERRLEEEALAAATAEEGSVDNLGDDDEDVLGIV